MSDSLPTRAEEFRRRLKAEMPRLQSEYAISRLELFGSYVRGDERPGSDLDVLVGFDSVPTLLTFIRLENELSDLLGVKVDLVMRSTLKAPIAPHVLAEATPL